jgi:polyhydroxyalkanoate synthesis regulator phasin
MASRRLHNRSYSVVSQADSDRSENMEDSNVTCFESDAKVTVRENPALEQANANIVVTSNDNIIICTDSNVDKGSISATQLQEFLSTLKQTIQSEICKQTATLEEKLTAESIKQSAESANLVSAVEVLKSELRYENETLAESLIARFESAFAAIREEFNAKISSEIRVVSDKVDDVSRDTENIITTLNNTIKNLRECMKERMNARVVQARKETDRQGQEITAALSSLIAIVREHKEQVGVIIKNSSHEIGISKEYTDSKFSTVSGEIQDIKQHCAGEISRLIATLGDLQAKLVTGTSDRTSPAVPVRVDVRSEAVQQVDSVINTAGSNSALPSVSGENGVNGCSRSVCDDVNSVIKQSTNSCSYGNVNVTSDLHAKSA